MATIGESHGDVAVSSAGQIYVSVEGGALPGIQVYSSQGGYLRNVPNAPNDLHGFVIAAPKGQGESIFGSSLRGERIVRLSLDGRELLNVPASVIPDRFKTAGNGGLHVALTGVAVASNGDIYAVDGYGRDFIHHFDARGRYQGTFGGKGPPWNFNNCHKIAIDRRFTPERLLCTDRFNNQLVHLDLNGQVIGVFAANLRWPSALAIYGNELAAAELGGRVRILDRQGAVIGEVGSNDNSSEIKTNQVPPENWQAGLFYAPHGITYTASGDLLVSEWSLWGRVVRLNRRRDQ